MNEFHTQIFTVIHQIPKGKISTYGSIAKMAGYPGYARHVGKALGHLPEDSTLPWHRVVNSQGRISLKGNDLTRQRGKLLNEGIEVSELGRISLKRYLWHPE
ncbi:MGMT family protein [Vibrio rumoiensis]|uniref:Methylated-DNA-[protein]-cysteine S-methyltransferase DNA binding domain-containing protein n=1 Tax=Vibrio rumoiensis 1S-45 TaxID=1188252 RepID=A0A1E5E2F1_9VIBR|nr:MGMT family protein [Vibrio rumoiensis]OEF25665.1 hypothetical protein A1QC_08520 [Vibrio rumoiensis 1S-45]